MIQQRILSGSIRHRISVFLSRQQLNKASTSTVSPSEEQEPSEAPVSSENEAEEARIAELRDISRMRSWHRSILHGEPPPIDTFKWQKERWALKERYATYGSASGVDPGVFWPTTDELEEIRQEDDELHPKLTDTIAEMRRLKEEREKKVAERYAEIEQKAKEYPKVMEAYRNRLREQQRVIDAEKQAKDDKIKEIQSYFGFAIEVSDPRFAAMMAKKELEEKQLRKKEQKRQNDLEAMRQIEQETKMLKQREQQTIQASKTETVEEAQPKAKKAV